MCAALGSISAQILLASADFSLSQSRKAVIETEAGWMVTISRNKQHALALLHNGSFDVLILCSSLSLKVHLEFCEIFRRRNPNGRVIVIQNGDLGIEADAMLSPPVAPHELLDSLRTVLNASTGG